MRALLAAFLLILASVSVAAAATVRVMRDGTGDFTTIQPAIDHAAPGDTILIGPGRYTEMQSVTLPGWARPIDICAYVRKSGLTFVGTNRDGVVIGPETAAFNFYGPHGISFIEVARGNVSNLTVINCFSGIYANAESAIDGCTFRDCQDGVTGFSPGTLAVSNCQSTGCNYGVICWSPTRRLEVTHSTFQGGEIGVDAAATPNVLVQDCVIGRVLVGIQFEQGSAGRIIRCRISEVSAVGIYAADGASVSIQDTEAGGGYYSVRCADSKWLEATSSIFRGGSAATIRTDRAPFAFHNCHILNAGGTLIDTSDWLWGPETHLNMINCYWGYTDRDSIAAHIKDGNANSQVKVFVDFEPFSATPLPTEKQSLGNLKSLYR